MSQTIPEGYAYHVVSPPKHGGLTCRFLKPNDFTIADLPEEDLDFTQTLRFLPLAVALTQWGPMVFTVAARPAFGDGAVSQWLEYICREEGLPLITPITETAVGPLPAVTCEATQRTDDGMIMRMRFVLFEDGGRLFQMSAMSPEPFWPAAIQKIEPMLASFELRETRGTSTPLMPGQTAPVSASSEVGRAADIAADAAAEEEKEKPEDPVELDGAPANSDEQTARLTDAEFSALVLEDTAASLDPNHPVNASLRDRGAGVTPRIMHKDATARSAIIAALAVKGAFRLPYGWHVIDDGSRTLVFDAAGRIQINLSLRPHDDNPRQEFARLLMQPYLEQEPDLPSVELELQDISGIGLRGVNVDGKLLDQYFLVRDVGWPGLYLVARVTATEDDSVRAMNLAGDIVADYRGPVEA